MKVFGTLRMVRMVKPPRVVDAASCVPLFCIAASSLFVVWHWSSQQQYYAPNSRLVIPTASVSVRQEAFDNGLLHLEQARCCRCWTGDVGVEKIRNGLPLHNWTDDKLFSRAIAMDTRKTPLDCASKTKRGRSFSPCKLPCDNKGNGRVKIAFLFMITTALPFEPLWKEFFKGKEGLYNIYVHADPFNATIFTEADGVFFQRLIPSKKAYRGSPSLVLASNRLMANAMLDDPSNQYFALLSGSCIPVRSFDHVYGSFVDSKQSFIEQITNETVMIERYSGREGGEEAMLPEITYDQFRKSAQWFVFTRAHALLILQDVQERKYWAKFDKECLIYFCGTDEHYYSTLLHILDPDGVSGTTVTYVAWPDYVSEHPLTFWQNDVNKTFIESIQEQNGGQYLFARKFDVSTLGLLMNLYSTVLK